VREQPRAVLDTNILVRAVLRPGGVSGQIFRAFRRRRFQLVTSPSLLDELVRVLLGPSVQRVADIREQDAVEIRANLEADAFVVPGAYRDVRVVPSDLTDDMLFAAALEARAPTS
jgi:putative PIN family toxin of toxin-antitoxin system